MLQMSESEDWLWWKPFLLNSAFGRAKPPYLHTYIKLRMPCSLAPSTYRKYRWRLIGWHAVNIMYMSKCQKVRTLYITVSLFILTECISKGDGFFS